MSLDNNSPEPGRIPPLPTLIPSSNPEEEVWNYIEKLTNIEYTLELLEDRVNGDFFGFGRYIERINRKKAGLNRVEFHQNLDLSNVKKNANEIVSLTKQAIELYRSSKQASLFSKPITLYYSYAKLGRVLFLSTYKSKQTAQKHGFGFKNNAIICKKSGAFGRFNDSYNWDPKIYLEECIFKWKDLIKDPLKARVASLLLNMKNGNGVHLKERRFDIPDFIVHELTMEYLFLYAMSFLARYRVNEWARLMSGSAIAWDIQNYLSVTQVLFPNLIFNQLHGDQYYFYPSEPEFMKFDRAPISDGLTWLI